MHRGKRDEDAKRNADYPDIGLAHRRESLMIVHSGRAKERDAVKDFPEVGRRGHKDSCSPIGRTGKKTLGQKSGEPWAKTLDPCSSNR